MSNYEITAILMAAVSTIFVIVAYFLTHKKFGESK